jgi:hypothetical protein
MNSEFKERATFYTALFDIKRENNDGRSMDNYIDWLRKTVKLFPGIYVFHDGCLNQVQLENAKKITVQLEALPAFQFKPHITSVINAGKVEAVNDITFKNPLYSIVQYSKFDLALACLELSSAKSLLWVDAGISRFVSHTNIEKIQLNAGRLLQYEFDFRFEVDCRSNFVPFKLNLSPSPVGSCKRVFSGTSFWMNANTTKFLASEIYGLLNDWKSKGIWDNDQVALRNLQFWRSYKIYIDVQTFEKTGSVARNMSDTTNRGYDLKSKIGNFLLSRSN